MARKQVTDMSAWPSLAIEGNLIAPAMVARLVAFEADEQSEESYGIRKGLTIREEISLAFRVGQSHFDAFARLQHPSVEATRRFIRAFLNETFGFADLAEGSGVIALIAGSRVPVVVVPPNEPLDRRSPTLSTDKSRSPAFALQDSLNDRDEVHWGLVTNGAQLRLMRDNASLTRPAYVEADLAQIFANEDAASFAALWLLIHRSRFGAEGAPPTDCALERWREAGSREGEAARDRLAAQVEVALRVVGSGFLEANPDLARRLQSGELPLTEWFNELLRLVYRLIFLMVAEDRNLLHPERADADARKLYAEGYGLAALRTQCVRAASWDRHHDRYEGMKIVFRALAHGEAGLALPALGGLFADDRLPSLDRARLGNRAFMEAVYRLSWLSDKSGMVPVNWRAMETEELGSVYESLLELQPQLSEDGRELVFASEAAEQKGNQRKTTGSYYTPDSLVQALLDTALDPVLDRTEVEAEDPAAALLKLSVIDPACGSGHFLLAAARRIATRLARIRAEGTPSLADFRHALRDVARCGIHGVDRNPMAVELTKVALWIETVDPGLPLGFFDAQIRCGDALLGVFDLQVLQDGIPDAAYKPLTGDDKETAKYYLKANRDATAGQGGFDFGTGQASMPAMKPLALDFSGFRDLPEDTVEQIGAKAKRFKELRKGQTFVRAKAAADLYVAAFLLPKVGGAPAGASARSVPTTEELWMALNQGKMRQAMVEAPKAARNARALHWPLEFPDVMQRGGFDVVLGNPPWERIKLQEQEFFAARDIEIATATNKAERDRLISALQRAPEGSMSKALFDEFETEKRSAEAQSTFVRVAKSEGGRFPYTGTGDVNTYALFAELFARLTRDGGSAGIIIPSGIATDSTTKEFFAWLVDTKRIRSLFEFENAGFFSGAGHGHMLRFALTTISGGGNQNRDQTSPMRLLFQAEVVSEISDPRRVFSLTRDEIELFNPNTKTLPIFISEEDVVLARKIYKSAPVLLDERPNATNPNPWGVRLSALYHMGNDAKLFSKASQVPAYSRQVREGTLSDREGQKLLPLYESRMFYQYTHRNSDFSDAGGARAHKLPEVGTERLQNPDYEVNPFYLVPLSETRARLSALQWSRRWLFGWRKVTDSRASIRTLISAVLPEAGAGDSINILVPDEKHVHSFCGLVGNFSSLVLDYIARTKVAGLNLNYFTLKQLPVLPPAFYTEPRLAFTTPRVLELTYTSHTLAPFARDLDYSGPPFAWDEERRAHLRADLDAFYARAYGLSRDELRYILDPADVKGPDYPSETFRVLKEKEIRQYGEYRTRRLVLAAWDRMEANGEFTALGM